MNLKRLGLVLPLLSIAGCMTLRPVPAPASFIPQTNPTLVWVTYTDNSIVPVVQPRIKGDTLLGTWQGLSEPVAIPLREVQLVQARQRDRGKTRLLIAGLAAFTAAGVYAIVQATGGRQAPCTGPGPQPGVDAC